MCVTTSTHETTGTNTHETSSESPRDLQHESPQDLHYQSRRDLQKGCRQDLPEEDATRPRDKSNENPSLDMSMRPQLQVCHWSPERTGAKQGRERDVKHTRNNALEALRADYGDVTNDDDGDQHEIHHDETFAYENPTRLEEILETTPFCDTPARPSGHDNESLEIPRIDTDLDENHQETFGLDIPPRADEPRRT